MIMNRKINTKLGSFKAFIFDQDGTLLDAEAWHCKSWIEVAKNYGVIFSENDFKMFAGKGDLAIARFIKNRGNLSITAEDLKEEKRDYYKLHLDSIGLCDGVLDLLKKAKKEGLLLALATISHKEETLKAVKRLGLDKYFDVIVDKDDIGQRIKPLPDIYLAAAKKLKISPKNCCAFEDSLTGVEAAKAARMVCIAIPTKYSKHFDYSKADLIINSLSDLKVENNFIIRKHD